jgi:hypothetical protein
MRAEPDSGNRVDLNVHFRGAMRHSRRHEQMAQDAPNAVASLDAEECLSGVDSGDRLGDPHDHYRRAANPKRASFAPLGAIG